MVDQQAPGGALIRDGSQFNRTCETSKLKKVNNSSNHQIIKMAPRTRSQGYKSPSKQRSRGIQANTPQKSAFYGAWDARESGETLKSICDATDTTTPPARRWLHQREILGSPAYRRTRKLSNHLEKPSYVSDETCKKLVSPSRNPVRDQLYEAQIAHHDLPVKKRQLQNRLRQATKGARRYKQAYIQKKISAKTVN